MYPSQTKILEEGTKDAIRISKEALFKGVSTRFGLRTIEKSVENMDFYLLFLLPKSSFGEHKSRYEQYAPQTKILESSFGEHNFFMRVLP
jgi:hypothetical protein